MKPTDFAYYLTNFLSKYLPGVIGLSSNTIMSYRDTFHIFLIFCSEHKKIKPQKFCLDNMNRGMVEDYLEWLEKKRKCIASTRNVRLSAFHSFCRYLQIEFPDYIHQAQQILLIPMKRTKKSSVEYITLDAVKLLLGKPDKSSTSDPKKGIILHRFNRSARIS